MLERLYVHNYRCFENFSIDFEDRSSALLIGKNGSGKSTLRNVLRVFQKLCRGSNRLKDLIAKNDFSYGRTETPIRFEVELKLLNKQFKYTLVIEWPENFREPSIFEERLTVDGENVFSRERAQVTLSDGTKFQFDWHYAGLTVINERSGSASIEQVKNFFSSMILISPIPSNMSGFSEEISFEIQQDAGNVAAWFLALISEYPAAYGILEKYLKSVIPDLSTVENKQRGEKGRQIVVKFANALSDRLIALDFNQLSDGEKCFFLSSLIVASSNFSDSFFCFWDEPDNHLSLSEVGHFVMELRKLTNRSGQLIATSHHPETIRRFSDDTTFLFTRNSHLEPTVVRLLEELPPYHGDLIEALIREEIPG